MKDASIVGFAVEIGLTVALCTVGGILLGRFMDLRWGIAPFGIVIGALIGIIASISVLVVRAVRLMK